MNLFTCINKDAMYPPHWEKLLINNPLVTVQTLDPGTKVEEVEHESESKSITYNYPKKVVFQNSGSDEWENCFGSYAPNTLEFEFKKKIGKGSYSQIAEYHSTNITYKTTKDPLVLAVKCSSEGEKEMELAEKLGKSGCGQLPMRPLGFFIDRYLYVMPRLTSFESWNPITCIDAAVKATNVAKVVELVRRQVVCMFHITGVPYADLKADNVLYRLSPDEKDMCVHVADLASLLYHRYKFEKGGATFVQPYLVSTFPPPENAGPRDDEPGFIWQLQADKLMSWGLGVFALQLMGVEVIGLSHEILKKSSAQFQENHQHIFVNMIGNKWLQALIEYNPAERHSAFEEITIPVSQSLLQNTVHNGLQQFFLG